MIKKDLIEFSEMMGSEGGDFIPIIAEASIDWDNTETIPNVLPILPLRGNVLFPHVVVPITAGREKSVKLVKEAYKNKITIGVVAQKNSVDDPDKEDLYSVGVTAKILRTLQMPDGNTMVILQGKERFMLESIIATEPYMQATVQPFPTQETELPKNMDALSLSVRDMYLNLVKLSNLPSEAGFAVQNIEDPRFLMNFVATHIDIKLSEKQRLLETEDFGKFANEILISLGREVHMQEVKNQIQKKVSNDLNKQQRDFFLNQQLKTIQEELGDTPGQQDINELKVKAKKKKWSKDVADTFEKELGKLQRMHTSSPDYSIQLNYLDVLVDLPWGEYSKDNFDLDKAAKILDADHYGLEKVKERILQYLAVLKLKNDMKSPILCLVGPPGVGKTSLGKSIAKAVNRKYIRVALGGLRDEAEIRGHRRTYIGAMPGRIIQSINKAKTSNPVFVLDEIDKVMGMSINGDPASALLEVLDPEQNTAFHDNFIDVDYDLSHILFVATANTLENIHPALIDRMEIVRLQGYVMEEKIEIAKRHLIPKLLREHGVKSSQISFSVQLLRTLITNYTAEAGVRQLEKVIAKLIRCRAVDIVREKEYKKAIAVKDLKEYLGLPLRDHTLSRKEPTIGVVTGLAWTSVGGEILFVEAGISKGKGELTLTGSLGDVMKESATLAYEYLKGNAEELGIDDGVFEKTHLHIHVPEGATPKDGPSAGVTMFTAMTSVFMKKKVRPDVAMTGEITLRGNVLPVGGIRDKILAAKRSNIKEIILCEENRKDVEDIPQHYLEGLTFHYVEHMKDVLKYIFIND